MADSPVNRDILLYVNKPGLFAIDSLKAHAQKTQTNYRIGIIYEAQSKNLPELNPAEQQPDLMIPVNVNSPTSIQKALLPYQDQILAISCRGEKNIPTFKKIIPHLPYLRTPTSESLDWTTDKILMRQRLFNHNRAIAPAFTVVTEVSPASLQRIEKKVGFPLIVKPAGLAESLLVSICYHKEELETVLAKTFRKINRIYREKRGRGTPKVLVEKFMEGEMYSVDAYVSSRGRIYFCPLVHVKTGRSVGFDDFFGYQRTTPTTLKKSTVEKAEEVAAQGIKALALRSVTAHVELMRTDRGWKIIEIGPRMGGFRHDLYQLSYGINHIANDMMIRIPKKPLLPKKPKGFTSALQFYAKKEGKLVSLKGLRKLPQLESFHELRQHKQLGDRCLFAKHGGTSIFNLVLFNQDRSKLLADVRRAEQSVVIETK